MLTLGLMEGIFTFTAIALVLFGGANANIPLHRILGPPALGFLAVITYAVYDMGAANTGWEVLGLLSVAFFSILAPLGVMSYSWNATKALDASGEPVVPRTAEAKKVAPQEATIHHAPTRRERRAH